MRKKKDFVRLIMCIGICMVVSALVIVLIDPFHHYHAPWFGMPIVLEEVVYQTPGNATNLDYTSAIVGTSMTENFRVSWFDEEMGWDTMKLCYSGAASSDIQAIMNSVYDNGRQVEHILMDLNDYQLTGNPDAVYVDRPDYLYNKNILDDYQYVYNRDVFVLGAERVIASLQGQQSNVETAYTWDGEELFGKERVLEASRQTKEMLLRKMEEKAASRTVGKGDNPLDVCQRNLDNIIPFIAGHPETEFFIFFPPYSMIYWEQVVIEEELEEKMAVYQYAIEQLMPYENVRIYYFQGEDFVEDLDEYRDATHHKPEYNRYIFECIKEDKKRLTEENHMEELEKVYQRAKNYDYELLWK